MRVLVTGSRGFIGSAICSRLARETDIQIGTLDILDGLNIESWKDVDQAVYDSSFVLHNAAKGLVASMTDPVADLAANTVGTLNVLEACCKYGVPVIFASTGSVHPGSDGIPPTPYGISKAASEDYLIYYRGLGLNAVTLRYFSVYGPGMMTVGSGVIGIFLRQAMSGQSLTVEGGEQRRAFCYVDDVVEANMVLMREMRRGWLNTGVFEVGSGDFVRIKDLAERIVKEYGKDNEIKTVGPRRGDGKRQWAETKALKKIGWEQRVSFDGGLELTAGWVKKKLKGNQN